MDYAFYIFGSMSSIAMMYLVYRQLCSSPPTVSYEMLSLLDKSAVNMLILTMILFVASKFDDPRWLWLAPIAPLATAALIYKEKLKRIYRKRTGKTSFGEGWVCQKCGAENAPIRAACVECEAEQPNAQ